MAKENISLGPVDWSGGFQNETFSTIPRAQIPPATPKDTLQGHPLRQPQPRRRSRRGNAQKGQTCSRCLLLKSLKFTIGNFYNNFSFVFIIIIITIMIIDATEFVYEIARGVC